MALEGPLKDLHIQDVFQLLDLGRKSGVLRVTSELRQTAGTVCFDRGGVVAAAVGSDPPAARRPGCCGRRGSPRPTSIARASMQSGGDDRRLGDILVGLGAISRRELDRQVKAQIEEAVFELLRWSEGYFRFEEGAACFAAVEAPVRFPTEALLMEAARRIDEWSRIGSKVSHLRLVPRLPPPEEQGTEPLDLVPFEWEVLAAVDGTARPPLAGRGAGALGVRGGAHRVRADQRRRGGARRSRAAGPGSEVGRDLAALLVPAREALGQGDYDAGRRRSGGTSAGSIRSCPRPAGCWGSATPRSAAIPMRSIRGQHGAGWGRTRPARRRRFPRWSGSASR